MANSMTGFGRGIAMDEGRELQVELKAVNHRYLDISLRMSKALGAFEDRIRKTLSQKLARGHVDVYVSYRNFGLTGREVRADLQLAAAYMEALAQIKERFPALHDDITLLGVSRLPDVLAVTDGPEDEEAVAALLDAALGQALESMTAMRAAEGENLVADVLVRIGLIAERLRVVEEQAPAVVTDYRDRLTERIAALNPGAQLDEARLATEVALFADRCSVTEEIVRLKSHLAQFEKTARAEGAVGRKLDFMVQEMNRETNTIGSKANDLTITNAVLEIKGEIEKIREQIQNIE